MKIVIDDLNAKVGSDNTDHERAMGKEGCDIMNNGERLLEFCTTYDLATGGTLFPHHEIHKLTWCSPNGRRADVASEHYLVKATLDLQLGRNGP